MGLQLALLPVLIASRLDITVKPQGPCHAFLPVAPSWNTPSLLRNLLPFGTCRGAGAQERRRENQGGGRLRRVSPFRAQAVRDSESDRSGRAACNFVDRGRGPAQGVASGSGGGSQGCRLVG